VTATAVQMAPPDRDIGTVAVLDDDADQAKVVKLQLQDIGVTTVIASLDQVPTIERAIDWIAGNAQAVICDVQLNHLHSGIDYNGAQLMSAVIGDHKIPGVLTTGFKDDVGMWVRPHRQRIPVLVSRDETEEPEVLIEGVETCRAEIANGRPPARETHRVPLYIEKAGIADIGVALDARVGGWSRKASIRFPAEMLGEQYDSIEAASAIAGQVFFARVNIGAGHETDLFFEDPEPELVDPSELPLHFDTQTS
jgi:CheY-like chemotaxis protein